MAGGDLAAVGVGLALIVDGETALGAEVPRLDVVGLLSAADLNDEGDDGGLGDGASEEVEEDAEEEGVEIPARGVGIGVDDIMDAGWPEVGIVLGPAGVAKTAEKGWILGEEEKSGDLVLVGKQGAGHGQIVAPGSAAMRRRAMAV